MQVQGTHTRSWPWLARIFTISIDTIIDIDIIITMVIDINTTTYYCNYYYCYCYYGYCHNGMPTVPPCSKYHQPG